MVIVCLRNRSERKKHARNLRAIGCYGGERRKVAKAMTIPIILEHFVDGVNHATRNRYNSNSDQSAHRR
jgi:hypothetical protein